jgi:hypothetical protein
MDITGNHHGDYFIIDASDQERTDIVGSIVEVGAQRHRNDTLRENPELSDHVVGVVIGALEWDRRTMEIVHSILAQSIRTKDENTFTTRTALRLETGRALEQYKRR